ncbi:MAG: hypothetical protein K0R84_2460 [Clostridia bacterium]|nr:hypothetical protein [Clostridia bacterium]
MTKGKSWHGAITIYLSIILSSVILLSGILMDIVRIRTAEVQLRRAVNTAAESALAGYHTKLKEDYGLFALHNNDSVQLEETIRSYLGKNLLLESEKKSSGDSAYSFLKGIVINNEYKDVKFLDIYDYRIEAIETVPIYNFTENEITRKQIDEYMKYRAPAQFAENLMEKLEYVSSTEKLTDAYKQKTAIEKKLDKVEKALGKLQKEIDAINSFNKNDFENKPGSNSLVQSYIELEIKKSVYKAYSNVEIDISESKEDKEKARELVQYARELYQDAAREAQDIEERLNEEVTDRITAVQNAERNIHDIQVLVSAARSEIETLRRSINKQEEGAQSDIKITAALEADIEKWEWLLDTENSNSIITKLESNMELIINIKSKLAQIPNLTASYSGFMQAQAEGIMKSALGASEALDISGTSELDEVVRKVLASPELAAIAKSAERFETIDKVSAAASKAKGKDPRKSVAEDAKKIKDDISTLSESSKKIEDRRTLPSYFINGSYPNKIFSDDLLQTEANDEKLSSTVEGVDVNFDEDSNFSEDAFGYITSLASRLGEFAKDMRDELYVNEYILAVFKDGVELKDSASDNKIKDTLFDKCEVEYILTGAASETQNFLVVKGKILLIRFGMNTLHVYSDPQKRLKALEIATAAAGFTGFGIPIVHNMLMCTWGMAEAFQDIKEIYDGKKVPFIKTIETWRTDLIPGGYSTKDDVQNEGSIMDFDYHDYLRLLLLVQNKEVKMNRIEDLIQLNMQKSSPGFELKNYNTYVKVNAEISIKYWFLTGSFIPSKHKTTDGRHKIHIEAWKGY